MCHSLFTLFLGTAILCFDGRFVLAQRDSNEDTSLSCGQFCPCTSCRVNERVFDCSNETLSSLDEITGSSCISLKYFTTFNFSHNNLQMLNNFEIFGFGQLCSLDLSHNKFTQVENLVFQDCSSISADFSFNNLTDLPSISINPRSSQLRTRCLGLTFNFSHNQITSLRDFIYMDSALAFYSAVYGRGINIVIDLSFNRIVTLSLPNRLFFLPSEWTLYYGKMTILLHNNQISSLESYPNLHDFSNYNEPRILLDLRQNPLSSLPPTPDTISVNSLRLNLEGNPWNCDCHHRWMSNSTSKLRQILNNQDSTQPFCQQPENVKGRPLLNLSSVEFVCPPGVLDDAASLDFTPSLGDNLELTCPIVGGDPPIESIEWTVWTEKGLPKPFLSVEVCANCSFFVKNINHNWEGIYQCSANNGIKVSFNISIRLYENLAAITIESEDNDFVDDLNNRGRHFPWQFLIVILLLVIVSFGFVVCYNRYRVHMRETSTTATDRSLNAESNEIDSNITPSPPVMFSTTREGVTVNLSRGNEYHESANKETFKGNVNFSYENVPHLRQSREPRTRDIVKSTEWDVPYTNTVCQQKTGLNSSYNNIKIPTGRNGDAKSGSPGEDVYEVTNIDEYSELTVVHESAGQNTYQGLILPQ
ncbi:Insulin-like growth factor-binding protein complex acid labile subunit [Holothuria leucospilota]|uniref:Insulin-like growth factor-binding protein complex acid labile subunit n=1 Tax=Holothuria leucospilota TaxID=206669 RepID=A0A9Q0YKH7_HOLLE|nr:Insulin-like growth factor-binding protein complex acid labile subunit [Holothuria leucospilota]